MTKIAKMLVWTLVLTAAPLVAQQRDVIITVYGGGADHLADLEPSPPAWFMPGYSLGASVGIQLNKSWAIHGDFTYTRNPVEGSGELTGGDVNRFFYGVHAEYRYPLQQWAPFIFGGLGAVSIDQLGANESFDPTTRPAAMIGGGVFYAIPRSRLEITGEVKGLIYNWNMAGYDRNMFDVTYTAGFACGKVNRDADLVNSPGRIKTPLKRTGPKGSGQSIGKSSAMARPRNSALSSSLISPMYSTSGPVSSGRITVSKYS